MKPDALTIHSWDDIVFENRHKDYGAYAIRQTYSRNMSIAILIVSAATLVACVLSRWLPNASSPPVILPTCGGQFDHPLTHPPVIAQRIGTPITHRQPPRVIHDEPIESSLVDGPKNPSLNIGNLPEPISIVEISSIIDCFIADWQQPEVITIGCDLLPHPVDTVTYAPVMPAFKGGQEAMIKWLNKNIKYPVTARRDGIKGTVSVSFVVNTLGKIVNVRLVQGIRADCDKEVVSRIAAMPDWSPGLRENNMPVPVRFILPVKFNIDD